MGPNMCESAFLGHISDLTSKNGVGTWVKSGSRHFMRHVRLFNNTAMTPPTAQSKKPWVKMDGPAELVWMGPPVLRQPGSSDSVRFPSYPVSVRTKLCVIWSHWSSQQRANVNQGSIWSPWCEQLYYGVLMIPQKLNFGGGIYQPNNSSANMNSGENAETIFKSLLPTHFHEETFSSNQNSFFFLFLN